MIPTKNTKRIKRGRWKIIALIIFLICCFTIISILFFCSFSAYKVISRIEKIKEYSQKDTKDYKTVGWLRVQGTNIDYPVIYAPGYDLAYKVDDFLWTEADYQKLNNIVYISGHNILNLSKNPVITDDTHRRFEQLMSFTYPDFVEKNKYVQYTINGEDYLYKIFAVSYPNNTEINVYNNGTYSAKQLKKYINQSLEKSIYDFDLEVDETDKIISLITCTRMYGRYSDVSFKVDARLVRKGESIRNYKVTKNDNYNEVEKIMKGGGENEKI